MPEWDWGVLMACTMVAGWALYMVWPLVLLWMDKGEPDRMNYQTACERLEALEKTIQGMRDRVRGMEGSDKMAPYYIDKAIEHLSIAAREMWEARDYLRAGTGAPSTGDRGPSTYPPAGV